MLQQAPQGRSYSTKAARVQETYGQHSQAHGVLLRVVLCRAGDSNSMILVGILWIFHDSMNDLSIALLTRLK